MPEHDLMKTFPAKGEKMVTLENWRTRPFNRWAYQHVSELIPTAPIWRGTGPVWELPRAAEDLSQITFRNHADKKRTVAQFLDDSQTDGFMAIHHGCIVTEQYRNELAAHRPHILMSVS